jgi:hypothetical protein
MDEGRRTLAGSAGAKAQTSIGQRRKGKNRRRREGTIGAGKEY